MRSILQLCCFSTWLLAIVCAGELRAWQAAAALPGMEQITEGRVTATIAFLASDELAGRATGSKEFDIAAAYVASRFRGAGLEGGGIEGSFYHETKQSMSQVPANPTHFTDSQGKAVEHLGVLAASTDRFQYQGGLVQADLANQLDAQSLSGSAVIAKYTGDAKGPRLLSQVSRSCAALSTAGAKCLLLVVPPDHELVGLAKESRDKPRMSNPRNRFEIPVILVPESAMGTARIDIEIPPMQISETVMRNVIGVLRGSDPQLASEAILYSAHLDHLGTRQGVGDGIFNGADDDATGVTAVLTLADAFANRPRPRRTLLFMTFWGEESGLLGSKQYVANPTWPLAKIVANVNIEMIGRPEPGAGGKIWMTGWNESNLGVLMNAASGPFGVDIFEHLQFSARLYRSSDNWSFAEAGVIAHSFSAGSLHADYHQPDDEWDRLEIPHMTRVIQGLYLGSQPMIDGLVTPQKKSN